MVSTSRRVGRCAGSPRRAGPGRARSRGARRCRRGPRSRRTTSLRVAGTCAGGRRSSFGSPRERGRAELQERLAAPALHHRGEPPEVVAPAGPERVEQPAGVDLARARLRGRAAAPVTSTERRSSRLSSRRSTVTPAPRAAGPGAAQAQLEKSRAVTRWPCAAKYAASRPVPAPTSRTCAVAGSQPLLRPSARTATARWARGRRPGSCRSRARTGSRRRVPRNHASIRRTSAGSWSKWKAGSGTRHPGP